MTNKAERAKRLKTDKYHTNMVKNPKLPKAKEQTFDAELLIRMGNSRLAIIFSLLLIRFAYGVNSLVENKRAIFYLSVKS